MSDFQLILIAAGALLIAGVYLLGRLGSRSGDNVGVRSDDPRPAEALRHMPELDHVKLQSLAREIRAADAGGSEEEQAEDKVIALHVMFKDRRAHLSAVINVLKGEGLRFGKHQIFHRHATRTGDVVYSVANMIEPGTLDPQEAADTDTPGVSMFLVLPGPEDGVEAFAHMLAAARRLADNLGGDVMDGNRSALSRQTAHHIREEIIEFQRRQITTRKR